MKPNFFNKMRAKDCLLPSTALNIFDEKEAITLPVKESTVVKNILLYVFFTYNLPYLQQTFFFKNKFRLDFFFKIKFVFSKSEKGDFKL